VKRNGHRLITDAALCIASSSKLKYGYRPAGKINACDKGKGNEETYVNMFKESKSVISIRMAKDSERRKTLTSQKDPAPPEGLLDQK